MKKEIFLLGKATLFILIICMFLFRDMIFYGKIPLAANFGVFFYQPWREEKFKGWEHGIPNKPVGFDDIRIFYPQRKFAVEEIKNGNIPFWNPYSFCGNIFLANSQTSIFYPFNILFLFFPITFSWSILSFSVPFFAGLGMYLFLRSLKLSFLSSLFGSLVFILSGPIITRTEDGLVAGHSLIWLPLVLFSFEKFMETKKLYYFIMEVLFLSLSVLAGWFQFTFYVFLVSFLYFGFRLFFNSKTKMKEKILFILTPFLISFLITSFHILPAVEALRYSPRGKGTPPEFIGHLMPPLHLITALVPDFFGNPGTYNYFGHSEYKEGVIFIGLIPLIFAISSFKFLKKNKLISFFLFLLFLVTPFSLNTPLGRWFLTLDIPILSSFLPNRILVISSFCLVILSVFSFEEIIKKRENYIKSLSFILLVIFSIFLELFFTFFLLWKFGNKERILTPLNDCFSQKSYPCIISLRNTIFCFLLFIGFAITFLVWKKWKNVKFLNWAFILFIFSITILEGFYEARKYLYFSEKQFLFPSHPVFDFLKEKQKENDFPRFISLGEGHIVSNISLNYFLFSPDGVDAMYPYWYGELVGFTLSRGNSSNPPSRIETEISFSIMEEKDWRDIYFLNFLRLAGIKYIITRKDFSSPPTDLFRRVWENEKWKIYEFKEANNKAFLVPNFKLILDKEKSLREIFSPNFNPRKEVIINEDFYPQNEKFSDKGMVEIIKYSPNKINLKVKTEEDGLLFLNDTFFPGWKARIDGIDTKIYRANWAFRAVYVPKGEHLVNFEYFPRFFIIGIILSSSSIILLIVFAIYFWNLKRNVS